MNYNNHSIRKFLSVASVALILAVSAKVGAHSSGYWVDSAGKVVRNASGDCWKNSSWSAESMLEECGGAPAPVAISDSDFDGVPDDQDQCPNTPGMEVDTNGCPLDSDGDGVIDISDRCPGTPAGVAVDSEGCPQVGETLMVLHGVNFATNSAELTSEAMEILSQAANVLNENMSSNVQVVGHTDSRGTDSYNQSLSERRAESVVGYLTSNGISAARLSSAGMGESQPIASNDTDAGMYQNRRVEFLVVE